MAGVGNKLIPRNSAARVKKTAKKYELFAHAYVANGGCAGPAAIAAGYSKATAKVKGCQLLQIPSVSALVAKLQADLLAKHDMTAESTMKQLAAIVHFDIRKLFDENGQMKNIKDLDDATAAALSSIEVDDDWQGKGDDAYPLRTTKVKIFDKNSALEKAMKHFGLLRDGANVNVGVVVISKDDLLLG